jgi:hypothetical protein
MRWGREGAGEEVNERADRYAPTRIRYSGDGLRRYRSGYPAFSRAGPPRHTHSPHPPLARGLTLPSLAVEPPRIVMFRRGARIDRADARPTGTPR